MDKIYRISATLDQKGFRFEIKTYKTDGSTPYDFMLVDIKNNTSNDLKNVRAWAYCQEGKQGELKQKIIDKVSIMLNTQKETTVALLVATKNTYTKYLKNGK